MQFRGVMCLVHLDGLRVTKGGPPKCELTGFYSKREPCAYIYIYIYGGDGPAPLFYGLIQTVGF